MSFRDNLQHLRATRNMTQEQLAMLVGVSRQSVTKWESERAYPEMDKLLKICSIFDCTLDELVSGDLTGRAPEPEQAIPVSSASADVCGYDEHMLKTAKNIALGVAFIILGLGASALCAGKTPYLANPDAGSAICLFVFIAIGLLRLIPAVFARSAFAKEHPYIADFYTPEQREHDTKMSGYFIAYGIGLILVGIGLQTAIGGNLGTAGFFGCVGVGVGLIVYGALMGGRLDVEDYNLDALSEFTDEEVASIVGADRAAATIAKTRRNRLLGGTCGVIMLVATILGISLMFWGGYEHNFWEQYFWLPWSIGGILCAIVSIAFSMTRPRGE